MSLTFFWRACQISCNYFLCHRHLNVFSRRATSSQRWAKLFELERLYKKPFPRFSNQAAGKAFLQGGQSAQCLALIIKPQFLFSLKYLLWTWLQKGTSGIEWKEIGRWEKNNTFMTWKQQRHHTLWGRTYYIALIREYASPQTTWSWSIESWNL